MDGDIIAANDLHRRQVDSLKQNGNSLYNAKEYDSAFDEYAKGIKVIENSGNENEYEDLKVILMLNQAQCRLKTGQPKEAESLCSAVLLLDKTNIKALYRRSQSLIGMHQFTLAEIDIIKASKVDPKNSDVKLLKAKFDSGEVYDEMHMEKKIRATRAIKDYGDSFFDRKLFEKAFEAYHQGILFLNFDSSYLQDVKVKKLHASLLCQQADCKVYMAEIEHAKDLATRALMIDENNIEALHLRASLSFKFGEFHLAKLDLERAAEIEPHNREVRSLYLNVKKLTYTIPLGDQPIFMNWTRLWQKYQVRIKLQLSRLKDAQCFVFNYMEAQDRLKDAQCLVKASQDRIVNEKKEGNERNLKAAQDLLAGYEEHLEKAEKDSLELEKLILQSMKGAKVCLLKMAKIGRSR